MKNSLLLLLLLLVGTLQAQQVQVNRDNRTIAVNATETVTSDADVAIVALGYHNYGTAQKETYAENVRTSAKILEALQRAGVMKDQIETGTIRVDRVDASKEWTDQQKQERQFEAAQGWKIRVSAKDASKLVDAAMTAGANRVEEINWDLHDRAGLQAKAGGAALAKARAIAEQMAQGLHAKLGSLVYASNVAGSTPYWLLGRTASLETQAVMASVGESKEVMPEISLFPEKVKQDATVYAVFAIE